MGDDCPRGGNPDVNRESTGGPQRRITCPRCGERFGNLPEHLRRGCEG